MNALSIPTTASTKSLTPLLGVLLALLISALDKAMATAAMPRAAAELAGFSRYPWTTTAHLLTSTIAMLVIAKMSSQDNRIEYPAVLLTHRSVAEFRRCLAANGS